MLLATLDGATLLAGARLLAIMGVDDCATTMALLTEREDAAACDDKFTTEALLLAWRLEIAVLVDDSLIFDADDNTAGIDDLGTELAAALEGTTSGDCDAGGTLEGPPLLPPPHAVRTLSTEQASNNLFRDIDRFPSSYSLYDSDDANIFGARFMIEGWLFFDSADCNYF